MTERIDQREIIESALKSFCDSPFRDISLNFFRMLGYSSRRTLKIGTPKQFLTQLDPNERTTKKERKLFDDVLQLHFLFQLTDAEFTLQRSLLDDGTSVEDTLINSYVFLALELKEENYTRTALSALVRTVNKPLPMPAILLLKHGRLLSIGIIHRRLNKRDRSRDVLEKVTLIKDIAYEDPIRAHLEILNDFVLGNLDADYGVSNFVMLHEAWQKRLGAYSLSNEFYREIADWYFWAQHLVEKGTVRLPQHCDTKEEQSLFLIRLLTRVIFCWFLVEKRLIPSSLFRENHIQSLIRNFKPGKNLSKLDNSPTYYQAVLQNLFFGTLNMPPEQRSFREKKKQGQRYDKNFGITNLWRYETDFVDADHWITLAKRIPFLNGGLFDCLDDKTGKMSDNFILDGFSDNQKHSCHLPNDLFFGPERIVDLSKDYGEESKKTARSKRAKVRGLIQILSRYKFTVEENTPLEEEIALDPELLGKVFENLLASFNPDTSTTARKALGAFYTPREIVNYMVDESLKDYLSTQVPRCKGVLDELFSDKATLKDVKQDTRDALIAAIGRVRILDPACGSGAFPMGALQRLVDLLQKLDPNNESWKRDRLADARRYRSVLEESSASKAEIEACDARISDIEKSFDTRFHALDFARKLYLIENCIFGIDIQPIATQIAKLRFFISLIVDQKIDSSVPNLGVRPLPNLETKIVAADSLIPARPTNDQSLLKDQRLKEPQEELQRVRHEYFNARSPSSKRHWRDRDEVLRKQIADILEDGGLAPDSAHNLAGWNPYDQNSHARFFDSEWMFGIPVGKVRIDRESHGTLRGNFAFLNELKGQMEFIENSPQIVDSGFDIVIGNPPYLRIQNIENNVASILKSEYSSAVGKFDVYVVFIENAFRILREHGVIYFIHPHRFLTTDYGRGIKSFLDKVKGLRSAILFGVDQVFNAATTYTGVFCYSKGNESFRFKHAHTVEFEKLQFKERLYSDSGSHWTLSTETNSSADLVDRLRNQAFRLRDICQGIYQGVITVGDDIFVLRGEIRGKYLHGWSEAAQGAVEIEAAIVKPLLKGENIRRYEPVKSDIYILYPHFKDSRGKTRPFEEEELRSKFPRAFQYLLKFKDHLAAKKVQYKTNPKYWYSLHRSREMSLFEQTKLLTPQLQNRPCFTIDRDGWFPDAGGYSLIFSEATDEDYEFYLGVMNSSVLWYFIRSTSNPYNNSYYYFKTKYLEPFSIPIAPALVKIEIGNLVRLITLTSAFVSYSQTHAQKNLTSTSSTRDELMQAYWERMLNGLVYELYFPDEFQNAGLRLFDLVKQAKLLSVGAPTESDRLIALRDKFEDLFDPNHAIRIALDKLQTLDIVRIIEGKA